MEINIDFDGTVVTHNYPYIGKDIGTIPVLKQLIEEGHNLILFTMRSGKQLQDAVNWFKEHNIPLYGINSNPTQHLWTKSPKSYAPLMIDDSALGIPLIYNKEISDRPYVDWNKVKDMLYEKEIL